MKMIKQPTDVTGCGVAVIAMLRDEKTFKCAMDLVEPNRDEWPAELGAGYAFAKDRSAWK
ncbi:hypothetical protein [Pseudomonas fluorescens]|uniref:Uncharacterized protein n=1 Tax=Pseudomonas fluorescens TaxID=294 RepID=A0A5E7ES61_PSEFL|nr:hypothetical protein [Pseudomonas fluorescens]VVO29676.1 hypothetical protein PS691_04839 [Pseudomonas fluorescens]